MFPSRRSLRECFGLIMQGKIRKENFCPCSKAEVCFFWEGGRRACGVRSSSMRNPEGLRKGRTAEQSVISKEFLFWKNFVAAVSGELFLRHAKNGRKCRVAGNLLATRNWIMPKDWLSMQGRDFAKQTASFVLSKIYKAVYSQR